MRAVALGGREEGGARHPDNNQKYSGGDQKEDGARHLDSNQKYSGGDLKGG